MAFKVLGILLLLLSAYLVVDALALSERLLNGTVRAQMYPLVAIALLLMVRVLQAEKHYREQHKQ